MSNWWDEAPVQSGKNWWEAAPEAAPNPVVVAPVQEEGIFDQITRRVSEAADRGIIENLKLAPLASMEMGQATLRGIESGLYGLGGAASFLGGIPAASIGDLVTGGQFNLVDKAAGLTDRYFSAAQGAMRGTSQDLEDQAAAAAGKVGLDLLAMYASGGSAGAARAAAAPIAQQSVRQVAAEAAEQAIQQGARASMPSSLTRGSELATQVIGAGGTLGEAAGAGATGASANTLGYMLPGAASGSLPVRAIQGAGIEVPAGYLQTQAENIALPDRLGLDQEYGAKDAFMDALLGAGIAGISGGRPESEFNDPDAMRGRQRIDYDSSRETKWFDEAPVVEPAPEQPPVTPDEWERAAAKEPASPPVEPVVEAAPVEVKAEAVPTEAPARSAEPQEGRVEVEAQIKDGTVRLVDEPAPEGREYSEWGKVRIIEAFDGDAKVGELLYANDGTPPTVNVEPEYQRKGVATAMYALAEQQGGMLGGREGIRGRGSQYRTEDGAAFRSAMDTSTARLRPVDTSPAPEVTSTPAPQAPVTPQTVPPLPASPQVEPVELSSSATTPAPSTASVEPTSTKNRVTKAEREAEGRDPILKEMKRSNEATVSMARQSLSENPSLVDEIVARSPDAPISSVEEAAMLLQKVQERNKREEASRVLADPNASESKKSAARRAWDDAEAKINEIDEANVARGREWGRFGQFRQRLMREDYSLEAMESKMRRAKGSGLSAEESAGLRELSNKLEAAQADLAESRRRLEEFEQNQIVRQTIEQAIKDAMGQARAAKKDGRSKLDVLRERAEAARKSLAATESVPSKRGQSGAVISPSVFVDMYHIGAYHVANGAVKLADWVKAMTADLGDKFTALERYWPEIFAASKAQDSIYNRSSPKTADQIKAGIDPENLTRENVRDLVMARIRAGEKDPDSIMRSVAADVKSVVPEATEADVRQLFADYAKRQNPTRDQDVRTLGRLRTIVRLQNEIARVEAGGKRRPAAKRGDVDAEVRALRARLGELLKQVEKSSSGDTPAVARQIRAETLQKQLADLEGQLEGNYRKVNPEKKLTTKEVDDLKKKLYWTRNRIRSIDKEINDAASAPSRAAAKEEQDKSDRLNRIDGLRAQEQEIRRQIEMGYRPVPNRMESLSDNEIDAARDAVKKARADLRAIDIEPKRAAELKERIADLEDQIATGRRPAPRGTKPESSPEIAALEARRDELIREIRDIDRPRPDPETRYQNTRAKTISNEIERLRERISRGDYSRTPKVPRKLTAENEKAAFELEKLRREFRLRQFNEELKQRSRVARYLDNTASGLNLARALMTSFDLSGLLRQGGFIVLGHPIRGAKAIPDMLKALFSEEAEHAVQSDIESRPNAPLYKKYGLQITSDNGSLSKMEEAYMTRFLNRMERKDGQTIRNVARGAFNLATAPVRGSARAYSTVLNKLRADSFDAMAATLSMTGEPTPEEGKALANYINAATGRGKVTGMSDSAAAGLNAVFFAPKLVASRFQMLLGQPLYGGSNRTRALIAKDYARYLSGLAVVYSLGYMATLARDPEDEDERRPFIELDPRSSAFGRMRFGDWFVDPLSGIAQVTTVLSRVLTGETKTGAGEVMPIRDSNRLTNLLYDAGQYLDKQGFEALASEFPDEPNYEKKGPMGSDVGDELWRFTRSKLAPVPGAIINIASSENMIGQPTTAKDEAIGLVTPMTFGNVVDAMKDQGVPAGTALFMAEVLGMGVQFRDRASFEAPDYNNMTFERRREYSEYMQRFQNFNQDMKEIRKVANDFPEDANPLDIRDAVIAAAESRGIRGVEVDMYVRNTSSRDEYGVRRSGVKRTESGNVKLKYTKDEMAKYLMDARSDINKINNQMEDMLRTPMSDEELDKIYRRYLSEGSANGDKWRVARAMADERDAIMRQFMATANED